MKEIVHGAWKIINPLDWFGRIRPSSKCKMYFNIIIYVKEIMFMNKNNILRYIRIPINEL